jgi:hypothetical protein
MVEVFDLHQAEYKKTYYSLLRGVIPMARNSVLTRGGAVVARRAHNPKVVGSNPTPATKS